MGYLIALRRGILNLVAAGTAIAEMPETGDLDLRRNNIFLQMIPGTDDILIVQRLSAIGAEVKFLVDNFIDVVGFFTTAAGLAGFLAQLFVPFPGAPGRLELGFIAARTWRIVAAGSLPD